MKIAANYTVFYGAAFIKYSLRSVYNHVDKIFIALGEKSWPNTKGERLQKHIDLIEKEIGEFIALEDTEKKVTLYKGVWQSDTDQRNFILEKARAKKMDYAMLVDSDEIWEKEELDKLINFIKKNPNYDVYSVGIMHYWRSLFYRFEDKGGRVDYVYSLKRNLHHHWVRYAGDEATQIQVPNAFYHHFGYAYPSYIVGQKVQYWEHNAEVMENWFEEIFLAWKPPLEDGKRREKQRVFAPTHQDWSNLQHIEPPTLFDDHPFKEEVLIP